MPSQGWTLNTIFQAQSGPLLDWTSVNAIYYGNDIQLDAHKVDRTFDTDR